MRTFICLAIFMSALSAYAADTELPAITLYSEENGTVSAAPESYLDRSSSVTVQKRTLAQAVDDLSIRGATFEDADVRLGGADISNPQTGHFSLSVPAVSHDIGSASVDAQHQKAAFELRMPEKQEFYGRTAIGSGAYFDRALSAAVPLGVTMNRLSIEQANQKALRPDTDWAREAYGYTFGAKSQEIETKGYLSYQKKDFGAAGAYSAPTYMHEYEILKQRFGMLDTTYTGAFELRQSLYAQRTNDKYILIRSNPVAYTNFHETDVVGASHQLFPFLNPFFVRHSFRQENLNSIRLGKDRRDTNDVGLGIEQWKAGPWTFDAAADEMYWENNGSKPVYDLGVRYALNDVHSVYAKAARVYREPSFTELYFWNPANHGNPDLKMQRSDNTETGYEYRNGLTMLGGDVFFRKQKNTIDWFKNASMSYYQADNAADAKVYGADLKAEQKFETGFLKSVRGEYTRMKMVHDRDYETSKYAFQYLRDKVVGTTVFGLGKKIDLSTSLEYGYHTDLHSRVIASSAAAYRLNDHWKLFADIDNIFNNGYKETAYVKGSPRFWRSGVEAVF